MNEGSQLISGLRHLWPQGWELSSDPVRKEVSWERAGLRFKCRARGRSETQGGLHWTASVTGQDYLRDPVVCLNERHCDSRRRCGKVSGYEDGTMARGLQAEGSWRVPRASSPYSAPLRRGQVRNIQFESVPKARYHPGKISYLNLIKQVYWTPLPHIL